MFDPERVARELVDWLKERGCEAGTGGAVFGLSGGLDSSVVAGLCLRSFGEQALGLIMPCESHAQDREHAELLASTLGLKSMVIDLERPFKALLNAVSGSRSTSPLVRGNLKARLRMSTLYLHANSFNYLVVGPGNRVELETGYFTKYGDGGADVMPLARLVKGQVRDVARVLGVPGVIISKPPSAGLWRGQTDEAEMGMTYDQMDHYFLTGRAPGGVKERIENMIRASAHKRRCPAVPE